MKENLEIIQKNLKSFIGKNKAEEAIHELKQLLHGESGKLNNVLLFERWLKEVNQKFYRGQIIENEQAAETNRISMGLLNLIDELKPADLVKENGGTKNVLKVGSSKKESDPSERNVNLNVKGNVSGNIRFDRHDTNTDQSVSDVTGEDVVITTGKAKVTYVKKMFVEIIPLWVWAVIITGIAIGAVGFWDTDTR